jgi:phasin family protein
VQQNTLDAAQHIPYLKAIEMTGPRAGPHPEDPDMANTKSTANTAKKVTEAAETFTADTQKLVSEQIEKLTKGFEDVSDFGQKNIDAFVKSSEIAAKAVEGINSEFTAYSKKAFDDSVAAAKDLASAKTVTELFEKQSAFAKSFFEGYVAQTSKLNEICAAATKDIVEPVNARVTAATEAAKSFTA